MKEKNIRIIAIVMALIMMFTVFSVAVSAGGDAEPEGPATTQSPCETEGHRFLGYTYNDDRTFFQNGTETQICARCGEKGETRQIKIDWNAIGNNIAHTFDKDIEQEKVSIVGLSMINEALVWAIGAGIFAVSIIAEPIRMLVTLPLFSTKLPPFTPVA